MKPSHSDWESKARYCFGIYYVRELDFNETVNLTLKLKRIACNIWTSWTINLLSQFAENKRWCDHHHDHCRDSLMVYLSYDWRAVRSSNKMCNTCIFTCSFNHSDLWSLGFWVRIQFVIQLQPLFFVYQSIHNSIRYFVVV